MAFNIKSNNSFEGFNYSCSFIMCAVSYIDPMMQYSHGPAFCHSCLCAFDEYLPSLKELVNFMVVGQ